MAQLHNRLGKLREDLMRRVYDASMLLMNMVNEREDWAGDER